MKQSPNMKDALTVRPWSETQGSEHTGVYTDLYSALGGTIWLLNSGSFTIQNFVEFCNFIEAIVLFPRVYVSPNPCPAPGHSVRDVDDFTKIMATEGALRFVQFPNMVAEEDKDQTDDGKVLHEHFGKMRDSLRRQRRVEIVDTLFGVAAHAMHGMTLYPSVHNRFAYLESLGATTSIRATLSLQNAYSSLSRAAQEAVRSLNDYRGVEEVFIPPIPALIMAKASSFNDIPFAVLEFRERLEPVRRAFTEYNLTISDSSVSLKKSLRAMTLLKTVVEEISRPFDDQGKRVIAQWTDLGELIPYDGDFDADDAKSLTKLLLGKPLEFVLNRLRRRRFLPLYSLRSEYMGRTDTQALVKKLWGRDVTDSDVAEGKTYMLSPTDIQKRRPAPAVPPPRVLGFGIWGNKHGSDEVESQQEDPLDGE